MQNAALAAAALHMAMPDLDFETGGQGFCRRQLAGTAAKA
jgi:hypothetical protein